jgi:RNA recognition motif-containing protein
MPQKLFVGRLPNDTKASELEDLFKRFGNVRRCDVKTNFAFVEFEDSRDGEDAIRDLNGKDFGGSNIVVQESRGPRDNGFRIPKPKFRVVVKGLADRTSWQDLKDFAREAGKPIYTVTIIYQQLNDY